MPLMTQDEYSKIEHETPYFYKIQNTEQFLYYFGERHSFNSNDTQWAQAKNFGLILLRILKIKKELPLLRPGDHL